MRFEWVVTEKETKLLKFFLRDQGVSRKLLSAIKTHNGFSVNDLPCFANQAVVSGDRVAIVIPDEESHETVVPVKRPLEILYEDRDLLVVNKPRALATIPSRQNPESSLANWIKGYYVSNGYKDQVIHIVTRLDRDTSGIVLIAKHRFSHHSCDRLLRESLITKEYRALVWDRDNRLRDHELIDLPIARDKDSIITRCVAEDGKKALTEYWVMKAFGPIKLVKMHLHTGRTHQIRVHFKALGCPLVGDSLYGGAKNDGIDKQALHCREISLIQPFNQQPLTIKAPYPRDMSDWLMTKGYDCSKDED